MSKRRPRDKKSHIRERQNLVTDPFSAVRNAVDLEQGNQDSGWAAMIMAKFTS